MTRSILLFLITAMVGTLPLVASPKDGINDRTQLRCVELLPGLITPLPINPAIPSDFVAMSPFHEASISDWVYWGPKDVLEKFFQNQENLDRPIIRCKLSINVSQDTLFDDLDSQFAAGGMKLIADNTLSWGRYPIREIRTIFQGDQINIAWVGLNAPGGPVIQFNLISPKGKLSKQDDQLWTHFLQKTRELDPRELYLASGQDLQPGFTIVTCNTATNNALIKVVGQQRKADGKVRVSVIPLSDNIELSCEGADVGRLGGEWKTGAPLAKVYCEVTEKVGSNSKNVFFKVASVILEPVDEFTIAEEDKGATYFAELDIPSPNPSRGHA